MNPCNTLFDSKRLIGCNFDNTSVQSDTVHWPFTVLKGPEGKPIIEGVQSAHVYPIVQALHTGACEFKLTFIFTIQLSALIMLA